MFCIHTASEHFDSYVKLVPFSCRAFISNPESCPQREKETMNKITQITIKKHEEKSTLLLYFNSAQTQTKQKSGTELRCYICNFNNRRGVYLHIEAGVDETKQWRREYEYFSYLENDVDQPDATERMKQCSNSLCSFEVKYANILHYTATVDCLART